MSFIGNWMELRMMSGVQSAPAVLPILSVSKTFGGRVRDAVNTNYALFGSTMTQWTLACYVPDSTSFGYALYIMGTDDDPYFQRIRVNGSGRNGVNCLISFGGLHESHACYNKSTGTWVYLEYDPDEEEYDAPPVGSYAANSEVPLAISRDGNSLYYSHDGSTWTAFANTLDNLPITNTLCIGACNFGGTLSDPFNSGGNNMDVVLYDEARVNVSAFINAHT